MNLFYHQAVEDVSKGKIPAGEHLTQLRLLKTQGKKEEVRRLPSSPGVWPLIPRGLAKYIVLQAATNTYPLYMSCCWATYSANLSLQYLDLARSLPDYNILEFPHCPCDARKAGHVVVAIGLKHLRLTACTTGGVTEVSCN